MTTLSKLWLNFPKHYLTFLLTSIFFVSWTTISAQTTYNIAEELVLSTDGEEFNGDTFLFAEGAKLVIADDITVTLTDCLLKNANSGERWDGIILGEDSTLKLDDTNIRHADVAITANSGNLDLRGTGIRGTEIGPRKGKGLHLTGFVNIGEFENSAIELCEVAIHVDLASPSPFGIFEFMAFTHLHYEGIGQEWVVAHNYLANNEIGFLIENGNAKIKGFNFIGNDYGIKVDNSVFTSILTNNFGGNNYCVLGSKSTVFTTGIRTMAPYTFNMENGYGIVYNKCAGGRVTVNELHGCEKNDIRLNSCSSIPVRYNRSNSFQLFNSSKIDIESNSIHTLNSNFGRFNDLENNNFNNVTIRESDRWVISDNSWGNNADVALNLEGSLRMWLQNNLFKGDTGLRSLNSSDNYVYCNSFETQDGIGLENLTNSNYQKIKGNKFENETGIYINSALGEQKHHANEFLNGSEAIAEGMTDGEILASVFLVDFSVPNYLPAEFNPSNWFRNDVPGTGETFDDCEYIPGFTNPGVDDFFLCNAVNEVLNYKNVNDHYYATRAYHLIYLARMSFGHQELPSCLDVLMNDPDLCTLFDLLEVRIALDEPLSRINKDNYPIISEAEIAFDQYEQNDSEQNEQYLLNKLSGMKSITDQIYQDFENILIQQELILQDLECNDPHINRWKLALQAYIRSIQNDNFGVPPVDAQFILDQSRLCADTHGNPVHMFRAILSNWDDRSTLEFDNCRDVSPRAVITKVSSEKSTLIAPNPNAGFFSVILPSKEKKYMLTIYDVQGKAILKESSVNGNEAEKNIDVGSVSNGYYILKLQDESGEIYTDKFIIHN